MIEKFFYRGNGAVKMNNGFYSLWLTISAGRLSISLYTMAVTLTVFSITHSATLSSVVMLAFVVGKLISSFVYPLVTEKATLKAILIVSTLFQLLSIPATMGLLSIQKVSVIVFSIMYIVIGIVGFMDGFISPSRLSLVPELVEDSKLGRANSLISTTNQTFSLVGWAIGPIVIGKYGVHFVLLFSFILLVTSFFSAIQLKAEKMKRATNRPKWDVIKAGWLILFSKKNHMRTITTMDIVEGIASGIWIGGITLLFVEEVLKEGEHWWGFINTSYYAGTILGGIVITILASNVQKHLIKGIIIGSFMVSILVLFYSINRIALLALFFVILMGPFYQLRDISQQTYIQKVTTGKELAKVYAAKDNLYYITFALSVFITGVIADSVGVVFVYYMAFFFYLMSTAYAFLSFRKKIC